MILGEVSKEVAVLKVRLVFIVKERTARKLLKQREKYWLAVRKVEEKAESEHRGDG